MAAKTKEDRAEELLAKLEQRERELREAQEPARFPESVPQSSESL